MMFTRSHGRALTFALSATLALVATDLQAQTIQDDLALFEQPSQPIPPEAQLPQTPTGLHIALQARPLRVLQGEQGVALREDKVDYGAAGHTLVGRVGMPDLTRRYVDVLVPFDADLKTLRLRITGQLEEGAGNFTNVKPVGRPGTTDANTLEAKDEVVEGVPLDAQGRDTSIYGVNGFFPARPVEIVGTGALRQYRYVRLAFAPYRWNPVTGQVQRTADLQLDLTWERALINPAEAKFNLSDPVHLEAEAAGRFVNFGSAAMWYALTFQFRRTGSYDFAIVLPQSLRSASTMLDDFVTHKEDEGYSPVVVSVEAIDLYYSGTELADRIRAFMQDKHADWGIEHLLLIGQPDPYDQYVGATDAVGSVPMKMAWPRGDGTESWNDDDGKPVACPTDHYYGDLSAEWDVDGDGYAAAFDDDYVVERYTYSSGSHDYTLSYKDYGIDGDMEARVGRIPNDDETYVDPILERIINYEDRDLSANPETDRDRVYLAMSKFEDSADYSYLGRDIHRDLLAPAGLSTVTLYEPDAPYAHSIDLENEALIDTWTSRGAGLVIWAGHGNSSLANIRYDDTDLMHVNDVATLDFSPRAFVFEGSCRNAWPESTYALAHKLILEGAMTTVAGTRNSYYEDYQYDFGTSGTIGDVAYWVARSHSLSYRAGYAILDMRSKIDITGDVRWLQNGLTYNLYGDPTVRFQW